LVHRDEEEVQRHHLDDRALPHHRRADARPEEALLGDRRVADPVRPEFVEQPGGHLVGAVEEADLLAHHEDAVVAFHLLAHREAQGLAVGHRLDADGARRRGGRGNAGGAHSPSPPAKTSSASPNGLPGRMRSNCSSEPWVYMPAARRATGGGASASAKATERSTWSSTSCSSASSPSAGTPRASSSSRVWASGSWWRCSSISSRVR